MPLCLNLHLIYTNTFNPKVKHELLYTMITFMDQPGAQTFQNMYA